MDSRLRQPLPMPSFAIAVSMAIVVATFSFSQEPRFESRELRWQLLETDCEFNKKSWHHRLEPSHEAWVGQTECIEFTCGPGTEFLVGHAIEPVRVIPELEASLPVNSSRPGVRIFVRIVLPHSVDPDTGRRLTVLLPGTETEKASNWQLLNVGGADKPLPTVLREKLWELRVRYGRTVTDQDAFVDQIVLNLFTSPGDNRIQIGQPNLSGTVGAGQMAEEAQSDHPVQLDGAVRQVNLQTTDDRLRAAIRRDGTVMELDEQPFFPRIVQHNGEAFEFLTSLGFNTIQLATTATEIQLLEAEQANVWLICPPPANLASGSQVLQTDRIAAWMMGDGLSEQEQLGSEQLIRQLRESDQRLDRPVVAGVAANWIGYAGFCDAIICGQVPCGSNYPFVRYSDWISACRESIGNALPLWIDLQTEFSQSSIRQIAGLVGQLPPMPIEPQQMLFGLYEALAGGARGVRFLSRTRLDAADPQSRLRAATIRWLNRKLDQLEPWAAAGVVSGTVNTGAANLDVTALKTNRATLLLVQQTTGWEQLVAGDTPIQTIRFADSVSSVSDRAYLLADYGLVPLSSSYAPTGTEIQIDACPQLAAIVLTQDPQVVNRLSGLYDRPGSDTLVNLHDHLTHQWFAIMQLIESQVSRFGGGTPGASNAINEALRLVRQAENLNSGGSPITAVNYLEAADRQLAISRRELLSLARDGFRGHVSAPLLNHVSLLPLHWQLAQHASQVDWQANGLGAGEFENLERLMSLGWENIKLDDPDVETLVELSPAAAVSGKFGLRIAAMPKSDVRGLAQIAPLKIVSGRVTIPGGKMIRIHGWVRIDRELLGTTEGLLIYDTLGGRDLGNRIPRTEGWEEVVMYRASPQNAELRLNFVMQGFGEVLLDEFTVRAIDLPTIPPRTARNPNPPDSR